MMNQSMMNRMDRKKEEMRNRIIDSAITLFDQFGIDEVTMDQIAEKADVAKGTLYNYFSSKDTVIAAYIQRSFYNHDRERIEEIQNLPNTQERLTFLLMTLLQGIRRQKALFEKYMLYRMRLTLSFSPISNEMESGLSSLIEEIIRLGRDEGDIRTDLPADLIVGFVEYILIAAIKPYYLQPETYDPQAAVDACIRLFINGSKSEKSEQL
ncbi:TetR/AcrR family transcriptional regulator [Flexilinea flocculi]|jgi:AcrR family transcriptional regulator|nr:TetR/AcrR family transcriptional regulator [Flexilinea flocculi]